MRFFNKGNIKYFNSLNLLAAATILSVLAVSILVYNSGYYNNYLIFSRPFYLLQKRESLYLFRIDLYTDMFKYSPFFAFAMGIFTYLPDELGIILWNMLGVSVLLIGIFFSFKIEREKKITLLILLPMILLSAYNQQSNSLLCGCLLLIFYFFEKQKIVLAALLISISFFIKGYGICAALLFILFNRKASFIFWMFFWLCLFTVLPLLFLPFNYLLSCYKEWINVLLTVHLNFESSIGGLLRQSFGIDIPDEVWVACGSVIFLLPFSNISHYKNDHFRKLLQASLMIFIIIFNKMAEIPTYIIATAGVCIWFNFTNYKNKFDHFMIFSVLLISILSLPVWPRVLLDNWLTPYSFVVIPYSVIWLKIQFQLWKLEFNAHLVPKISNI